ncbi:hypothetical protein AGLY_016727 [Aphis glycines]|uniref:HAT C-terminal dimerisation domain-containing protein n=1 Tax=Aphis glycines TaxID=307491 RepID=A0A6G0SX17_APHGL|nr:hypothetical protein AGLY_016727 [Aphis glycines]
MKITQFRETLVDTILGLNNQGSQEVQQARVYDMIGSEFKKCAREKLEKYDEELKHNAKIYSFFNRLIIPSSSKNLKLSERKNKEQWKNVHKNKEILLKTIFLKTAVNVCKLFGDDSQFGNQGFNDWKNANKRILHHENSKKHKDNIIRFSYRQRENERIDTKLCQQIIEKKQYWSAVLTREIEIIKFLASRGLSFRVDSTPDIAHIDQLIFMFRYVLPSGSPVERFFMFIDNIGHKSKELADTIIEVLKNNEIPIEDCRGQSYDNATNMSGHYSGLQTRIKNINPLAEYVPCAVTRWSARADACYALFKSYSEIVNACDSIANDVNEKIICRNEAKRLVKLLNSLEMDLTLQIKNCKLEGFKYFEEKRKVVSNCYIYKADIIFDDTESNSEEHSDGQTLFKRNAYFVIINNLVASLALRNKAYIRHQNTFGCIPMLFNLPNTQDIRDTCNVVAKEFVSDIKNGSILTDECNHFVTLLSKEIEFKNTENHSNNNFDELFPNLCIVFRIYLSATLTNCSGERSFSVLKRIKNYLRSTTLSNRPEGTPKVIISKQRRLSTTSKSSDHRTTSDEIPCATHAAHHHKSFVPNNDSGILRVADLSLLTELVVTFRYIQRRRKA